MTYHCFTCGFVQDFEPTPTSVALHHPWMCGLPVNQCPACTKYIQTYGGRKNGKVQMPDISEPGVLVEGTEPVQSKLAQMHEAWCHLQSGDIAKKNAARKLHAGKKLFGWSTDEVEQLA